MTGTSGMHRVISVAVVACVACFGDAAPAGGQDASGSETRVARDEQPQERATLSERELRSPRLARAWAAFESGDRDAFDRLREEVRGKAPLVEEIPGVSDEVWVTFFWWGDEDTWKVDLYGGVPAARYYPWNKAMERLPGTRVWFRTERVPTDARFHYGFHINAPFVDYLSEAEVIEYWVRHPRQSDPLNPKLFDDVSYVELADAPDQPFLRPAPGSPKGFLRRDSLESAALSETRRVTLYTPPAYDSAAGPYPLLVVFDGEYFDESDPVVFPLPTILDNLIVSGRIPPMIAAFVDNQGMRDRDLTNHAPFAQFVARELAAWLRERLPVTTDPDETIALGFSNGGLAAAYVALNDPGFVHNVVGLSTWWAHANENFETNFTRPQDYRYERGWIVRQFARRERLPLRFYLTVGRFDTFMSDNLSLNRHARDVLIAKGYPLVYEEFNGGHDAIAVRGKIADGLLAIVEMWRSR